MPFKRNKEESGGLPNWMMEPDQQVMPVGSNSDLLSSSFSNFSGMSHQLPLGLQSSQIPNFKGKLPIQKKVAFEGPSQWPDGRMAPMGIKRTKKEKKNKKKDKHKDVKISGPIGNVVHVGLPGTSLSTEQPASSRALGPGEHTIGENWILGPKPPAPFPSSPQDMVLPRPNMSSLPLRPPLSVPPPPPSQAPPSLPSPTQPPGAQPNYSLALPTPGSQYTPTTPQHAMPSQAEGPLDNLSIASGSSKTHQHDARAGGGSRSVVDAKAGKNSIEAEIKRTMKASKIQRDVDILNHVLDDLEEFMKTLKDKAAAWAELEKMSKKSRRKKDSALEYLKKRADPPTEQEFVVTYQKCKYGINLISKLGHHLSSPTPQQLLKGFFVYIQEMVNMNKGTQLASNVKSPLFTKTAYDLMKRKLEPKNQELWGSLGANWLITIEQWPSPPPEYEIEFSDGCVPATLHNSSDCPSNFPTLDTLPREHRNLDYSEAYDGDNTDGKAAGGLMISPAVMYLMGATPKTSSILPSQGLKNADFGPGQLVATRSQQSLHSSSSQENDPKKAKVIFDYETSAPGEISVRRGETVEVLDETGNWWQVKNKMGASGNVPANVLEAIIRRKSKDRGDKPLDDANMISLHGRNVPAPPKSIPPPIPGMSSGMPHKASPQLSSHGRRVSQQPQNLSTVPEDSESRSSTISRPAPPHPPLGSPPPFSPVPPPQQSFGIPMSPPGAFAPLGPPGMPGPLPPPAPPPPPVATPKAPVNLSAVIQQNKMKAAGKPKKSDKEFDIADALSKRQPLRKTSTAVVMHTEVDEADSTISDELQAKLLVRKSSVGEIVGEGYQVLPWKATVTEMKRWLIAQGYGSCAEKVTCKKGKELYAKTRDQLREMLGGSDGVRLYSQLQTDKKRAQKEGGVEKVSEFQKLMQARRTAADEAAVDEEPALVKGWGGRRVQPDSGIDKEEVPIWKQKFKTKLAEKETVFDGTISRPPGKVMYRDTVQRQAKYGRDGELRQKNKSYHNYSDEERRGRRWNDSRRGQEKRGERYSDDRHRRDSHYSDGERDRRRGRNHDDNRRRRSGGYSDYEERDKGGRRRKESRSSHGRRRRSSTYSDDEGYKSRRHKGNRKRDDSYSDYDSEYGRKKKDKKDKKKKDNKQKRSPTNIDDYDGYGSNSSYTSESSSDSDTSTGSDSSDSDEKKVYPDWAIAGADPSDIENISERIKSQQVKIKQELTSLSQLQKESGSKTLAPQQQKTLQQDLLKLEQLQTMLRENKGNLSLQTQLLGQQMLLFEHLTEAEEAIKHAEEGNLPMHKKSGTSTPSMSAAPSDSVSHLPGNLQLQMLQQKALAAEHQIHAMAAEHQLQALAAEQQLQSMVSRQMQAEQQRQMMAVAEQQRQLHVVQMADMSSPSSFMTPQQAAFGMNPQQTAFGMSPQQTAFGMNPQQAAFGMSPMSPAMYSPYGNSVAYF